MEDPAPALLEPDVPAPEGAEPEALPGLPVDVPPEEDCAIAAIGRVNPTVAAARFFIRCSVFIVIEVRIGWLGAV
jgi:hypothetical protein